MEIRVVSDWFSSDLQQVKQKFNLDLFKALNPPWMPAKVERFDGCEPGDIVRLKLGLWPIRLNWESLITESNTTHNEWYFVDEGKVLPFFIRKWRHVHRIEMKEGRCRVVDCINIQFRSSFWAKAMMPVLRWQFNYRKPVYLKWLDQPGQ